MCVSSTYDNKYSLLGSHSRMRSVEVVVIEAVEKTSCSCCKRATAANAVDAKARTAVMNSNRTRDLIGDKEGKAKSKQAEFGGF